MAQVRLFQTEMHASWKTGEIGSSRRAILSPLMGVLERMMFYSYLLWILVFAVVRLHAVGKAPQDHIKHSIEGLQV